MNILPKGLAGHSGDEIRRTIQTLKQVIKSAENELKAREGDGNAWKWGYPCGGGEYAVFDSMDQAAAAINMERNDPDAHYALQMVYLTKPEPAPSRAFSKADYEKMKHDLELYGFRVYLKKRPSGGHAYAYARVVVKHPYTYSTAYCAFGTRTREIISKYFPDSYMTSGFAEDATYRIWSHKPV